MSTNRPTLDQALDPLAHFFESTVHAYDDYLKIEYKDNRSQRGNEWYHHYRNMRDAFMASYLRCINGTTKRIEEMNIAVVGPGFDPYGSDFGKNISKQLLQKSNNIVVVDFSQAVVHSAMKSLMSGGVSSEKLLGMQYDVTSGVSTTYANALREILADVETQQDFLDATHVMTQLEMKNLDERLIDDIEREDTTVLQSPHLVLPGGMNQKRIFKLSVGSQPLPLDLISCQMVMAGTGAAAERQIWSRALDVSDNDGSEQIDPHQWEAAYENIHTLISRFNTTIALRMITQMLRDNPNAKVLSITDVTTNYKSPSIGGLERLNLEQLRQALSRPVPELSNFRIRMHEDAETWHWNDEPEHSHRIAVLEFSLAPIISQQSCFPSSTQQ